jgi:hypothetical protein
MYSLLNFFMGIITSSMYGCSVLVGLHPLKKFVPPPPRYLAMLCMTLPHLTLYTLLRNLWTCRPYHSTLELYNDYYCICTYDCRNFTGNCK